MGKFDRMVEGERAEDRRAPAAKRRKFMPVADKVRPAGRAGRRAGGLVAGRAGGCSCLGVGGPVRCLERALNEGERAAGVRTLLVPAALPAPWASTRPRLPC